MTNEELRELRRLYLEEQQKRIKMASKMEDERSTHPVHSSKIITNPQDILDARSIFRKILQEDKLIELSGNTGIYFVNYSIDSSQGRNTYYGNLENFDKKLYTSKLNKEIEQFERENDVIGAHNTWFDCREAQSVFFLESFENGQEKARQKVIKMYGTTRNN